MPFLAAIPASVLPALIGAGGTIGGTLLAGRKSGEEKDALSALAGSTEQLTGMAEGFQPTSTGLLDIAKRGFQPAMDYWTKILSGDRGSIMESLSPEIRQLSEGYDTARNTAAELMPRGGGSASLMAGLPYAKAGNIMDLFSGKRTAAATELPKIGSSAGYLGSNLANSILGALSGANAGALGQLNYGLSRREQDLGIGSAIGRSIFDLVKMIPGLGGDASTGKTV